MNHQRLFIVSGASRGLGRAIAAELLAPDSLVLALSRSPDPMLERDAARAGSRLEQWAVDVSDPAVAARLGGWLTALDPSQIVLAALINNAGVVGTVGPLDAGSEGDLAGVLRINLEGPMHLAREFLKATRSWPIDKRILNVSSGAARRAIAGWAAYCASKAGLDHFSRVVALDEALADHPTRIVSLAPGVIDTDMQQQLRASDAAGFPDKDRFVELKASGQLSSPVAAARRVVASLLDPEFGSEPVADVRTT